MQETTNYGLKKPEANDNVEIADLNDNTDIIDRELKKLEDGKAPKDVATTSKEGLMSKADKSKLDGIAKGANNYSHPETHPATMITEDELHRFLTDVERAIIQEWETFKTTGGEIGGTIIYPKGITRQIQQVMNLREKDYIQRMGLSNYNGYPCWSAIIEDPTNAENTNGLLFMLGSGVEGDAYRDNYVRPLKMGYTQRNHLGSPNVPWDDMHLRGVSKSANGYTKLPNGMIMQWGSSGFKEGQNSNTVTFPIAFPNKCVVVNYNLTGSFTVNPIDCMYSVGNVTQHYFDVHYNKPRNEYQGINWIAIGY